MRSTPRSRLMHRSTLHPGTALAVLVLLLAACSTDVPQQPSDIIDGSDSFGPIDDPGLRDYGINRAPEPRPIALPPVPRALTATPGRDGIRVSWWDVDNADAYALYIAGGPGETPDDAERIQLETLHFMDNVPPGTRRTYAVAAIIDGQEGALSGEFTVTHVAPERQRQLRLSMRESDLDHLFTRNAYSNTLLPAQLSVLPDMETVEVEGVRFRGAGSRRYPKFGFHIRTENRPHFNFGDDYRRGGNRILTNALWTDPSAMRDAIAYQAYIDLGMPSPRTQYAEFYINDIFEGFYVLFERIDREFLHGQNLNRRRGGMSLLRDDMKGNRRRLDMEDNSATFGLDLDSMFDSDEERISFLQEIWEWRGEMEDHDWVGLLDLVRWAWNTPAGDLFEQGFRERFRADEAITFLAIHSIFMDTDSLNVDLWYYRDEDGDGLWRLIPWDKNLVLGGGWYGDFLGSNSFFRYDRPLLSTLTNMIFEKLLQTRGLYDQFEDEIRRLLDEVFHREWLEHQVNHLLPQILDGMTRLPGPDAYHRQPSQHHDDPEYLMHHVEQLGEFMDLRRAWLIIELERRRGRVYGDVERARRERFGIRDGRRRCLTDQRGHTWACLSPRGGDWTGSASVAAIRDDGVDGVNRRYIVQFTQPFQGELTLFYHNAPGRNWLQREEWAGDQWRLDMVHTSASSVTAPLRTRVNPFANMVVGQISAERGVHTFTLEFGPVPEHRRSTAGDDEPSESAEP
ncbi:MAG: hypothetical protein EA398_07145 [Deltaproteobacteria bacterium]|nr:MAG: hypothetical protein EA398_07145 [Deltaproteobacteria bacterium]